jgi:mRNA interferase MazF
VIVSLDALNQHLQTVTICPLTTQLHTVGKARLGRKLGRLSSEEARALRRLITEMYGE